MDNITFVNLLLIDGNKVLMQLRDNKPAIFAPGVWAVPGGRVDEGEEPDLAVVREFKEETDYSATPKFYKTYPYDFIDGSPLTAFYYDIYDSNSKINCNEGQAMEFKTLEELESLTTFPIHTDVVRDLFEHLNKSENANN